MTYGFIICSWRCLLQFLIEFLHCPIVTAFKCNLLHDFYLEYKIHILISQKIVACCCKILFIVCGSCLLLNFSFHSVWCFQTMTEKQDAFRSIPFSTRVLDTAYVQECVGKSNILPLPYQSAAFDALKSALASGRSPSAPVAAQQTPSQTDALITELFGLCEGDRNGDESSSTLDKRKLVFLRVQMALHPDDPEVC